MQKDNQAGQANKQGKRANNDSANKQGKQAGQANGKRGNK